MLNSKGFFYDVKQIDITPNYSVSLLGYFNERISQGIYDPLYARLCALKSGTKSIVFIQLDTCVIPKEFADSIKEEIESTGLCRKEDCMIFASHTHTAPGLSDLFRARKDARWVDELKRKIITAAGSLTPIGSCSITLHKTTYKDLCYNRRWIMEDGSVMTNPPKGDPRLVRPEGPVDREVEVVAIYDTEKNPIILFVNISNHTDTVGGNYISADWPGFTERYLRNRLGNPSLLVVPMIAPQGNINHFDFHNAKNQTGYDEARRIGNAYGEIVSLLIEEEGEKVEDTTISSRVKLSTIPLRELSEGEIQSARDMLRDRRVSNITNLTAEDLAEGKEVVRYILAEELMAFVREKKHPCLLPLQVIRVGSCAFVGIPGEPFVEMGLRLKQQKRFSMVIPIVCANGYYGYIPTPESFKNGGYETKTTRDNCLTEDAFNIILDELTRLLNTI